MTKALLLLLVFWSEITTKLGTMHKSNQGCCLPSVALVGNLIHGQKSPSMNHMNHTSFWGSIILSVINNPTCHQKAISCFWTIISIVVVSSKLRHTRSYFKIAQGTSISPWNHFCCQRKEDRNVCSMYVPGDSIWSLIIGIFCVYFGARKTQDLWSPPTRMLVTLLSNPSLSLLSWPYHSTRIH